jgi:hypothetical protein
MVKSLFVGLGLQVEMSFVLYQFPLKSSLVSSVSGFGTSKNRVVKITYSNSEVVLQTTNYTVIHPGLGPSLEVIALYVQ